MQPEAERNKKRAKTMLKWLFRVALASVVLGVFALACILLYAKILGPPPLKVPQTTVFYSADGAVIGEIEHQNQNRYWVELEDISKKLVHATVAIEDRRYFQHNGFDFRRIAGAALTDIRTLSKAEGASTITMQYARNLFLTYDKTWKRKLLEAFYTIRLEMNYSKKEILEGYLNTIYYGHGAYGIQAAAKYYFGKDADDLTLAEASILAAIPKAPSYYTPDTHYENAKRRQKNILQAMVEVGYITKKEANRAYQQELEFVKKHDQTPVTSQAPYFQNKVEKILKNKLNISESALVSGGLKVYTTLDTDLQKQAEYWVEAIIDPRSEIQAALVSMDPETGAVKAMIGGRNFEEQKFNFAIQAKRQPGSSFKPFLYYAALKNGYTPSTTLTSEPTVFHYNNGESVYSPNNYGGYYANGPITLMQALALSDNIYAVKTNMAVGPEKLVKTAHKMGIESPLASIPSLALGTKPVSVLEMTRAYSTIANYGERVQPHFIKKVVNADGEVIYEWNPTSKQVLDPATSYVLAQMMTGVFDSSLNGYTSVTGDNLTDILSHKIAAKTGTTKYDSWMVGFTPEITTSVWVGYKDWRTISTFPDSRYSKKIWAHYMEAALKGHPENPFKEAPDGVVGVLVDTHTGKLASPDCPNMRKVFYRKGQAPQDYCTLHGEPPAKKKQEESKDKNNGWWDQVQDWMPF